MHARESGSPPYHLPARFPPGTEGQSWRDEWGTPVAGTLLYGGWQIAAVRVLWSVGPGLGQVLLQAWSISSGSSMYLQEATRHEEGNPSIFHRPTLASEPGLLRALQLFDTADQDFLLEPTSLAHTHPLTTPYEDCFRWDAVVHKLLDVTDNPLYCVIFRSVRNVDADTQELYSADAEAHEEALKGGGLLKYWYGTLNSRRECLATCIWSSRESARAALGRPAHAHAMRLASKMYQTYTLERCWLRRGRGGADERKIVFEMF